MSFIKSRLKRIESASRRSYRCPECGLPPDGPGHIVSIDEERPEESFKGDPEERCARCDRWLWCVMEVHYDSAGDAERGGGYRWP